MKMHNQLCFHQRMVGFWTLALCFFISAAPAFALLGGKVESFSAENVEIEPGGKVINTSKIYVTPDAIRMDGMPGSGRQGMPTVNISMLILKKQNRQFFYNHDKKLVFQSEIDEENLKPGYKALDQIESERVLGKENISGYSCVKKEVITSYDAMGMAHKNKLLVWESDQFEFPLKTQDKDGFIQLMRNIKKGKPSKKLFRPSPGYKKTDNMMALMGMDFGAMGKPEAHRGKTGVSSAKPTDMQDVDVAKMMAQMKQAMGENADPAQMAQMEQIMTQAIGQAKQIKQGKGAAGDLWKIIPRRAGDQIGHEMKVRNTIDVILGTQSSLRQVFDYYEEKLKAKGWQDGGTFIQNGQGTMSMSKGEQMVMFAWADNPGMPGDYKLFYNIHYTGAGK